MLETGTTPIDFEIHKRQLNFLHHILSQDNNDPVKVVYYEQLKYPEEPNWANEVKTLRTKYQLKQTDNEIINLPKDKWKGIVKENVRTAALDYLKTEAAKLKQGEKLIGQYDKLETQKYILTLNPDKARKLFHIRTGTIDVKTVRKYKYGEDKTCRLCLLSEENAEHIVNDCISIPRTSMINNVFTSDIHEMELIAERCVTFTALAKEIEEQNVGSC